MAPATLFHDKIADVVPTPEGVNPVGTVAVQATGVDVSPVTIKV